MKSKLSPNGWASSADAPVEDPTAQPVGQQGRQRSFFHFPNRLPHAGESRVDRWVLLRGVYLRVVLSLDSFGGSRVSCELLNFLFGSNCWSLTKTGLPRGF